MPKKVLIAGASGYLGSRLCSEFYSRGYLTYALGRSDNNKKILSNFIENFFVFDLQKKEQINKIVKKIKSENISNIIASVGSVDYHQSYELSKAINVETTKNIIEIALKLQKQEILNKLVFVGSVASRGFFYEAPTSSNFINESTDYYKMKKSIYSDVKRESENLIRKAIKDNNLKALIVEPGSLVGRDAGNKSTTSTSLIQKIIKGFPVLGGGASYCSVYKVAEGIALALENGIIGESYLLGGENLTMIDFARLIKKIQKENYPDQSKFNSIIPIFSIPKTMSFLLGYFNIVLNLQQAILGNTFHYIDSTKAKKDLGYNHSYKDLEDAIIEVLAKKEV